MALIPFFHLSASDTNRSNLKAKILLQLPRACAFVILDFLTSSPAFVCSLAFIGQYSARHFTIISLSGYPRSAYCCWIVLGNLDSYVTERMQASTCTKAFCKAANLSSEAVTKALIPQQTPLLIHKQNALFQKRVWDFSQSQRLQQRVSSTFRPY